MLELEDLGVREPSESLFFFMSSDISVHRKKLEADSSVLVSFAGLYWPLWVLFMSQTEPKNVLPEPSTLPNLILD